MTGVRKMKVLNNEGAKERNEFKPDRQNATLNRKRGRDNMCGHYIREMPKAVDKDKT